MDPQPQTTAVAHPNAAPSSPVTSLILRPRIEAVFRGTNSRHCIYVARLVGRGGAALSLTYPSGVASSVVNIGEGKSFLERWLTNDKARHIASVANHLHECGVCEHFCFEVHVDAFAIESASHAHAIELVLERCFMAACHCPPFFQEVRGQGKKLRAGKEVRLYWQDHTVTTARHPACEDYARIEHHVLAHIDPTGQALWCRFKAAARSFFGECTTTRNDVSLSFITATDPAHSAFGNHVVNGVAGELPTGKGKHKHRSKVRCFHALQNLARDISTPARMIVAPLQIPIGQNGQHGMLMAGRSTRRYMLRDRHGALAILDPRGNTVTM